MRTSVRIALSCAAALLVSAGLVAESPTMVTITSSKDNTLIETADGSLSLGSAPSFYAGRVGNFGGGTIRRGVIAFDVAGTVPEGAIITDVTLTLYMSQSIAGNEPIVLKRLLADWGEGTSSHWGGVGVPATNNDATWLHRFWPNVMWDTPGGDFVDEVSASKDVFSVGWYTWASTPQLVNDVQDWLDDPSTNFGWLVQGNEATTFTVKQFTSREGPIGQQPELAITYTIPPECGFADLNCDGSVGVPDLLILLGAWGPCDDPDECPADLTGSGAVGVSDLLELLANWG